MSGSSSIRPAKYIYASYTSVQESGSMPGSQRNVQAHNGTARQQQQHGEYIPQPKCKDQDWPCRPCLAVNFEYDNNRIPDPFDRNFWHPGSIHVPVLPLPSNTPLPRYQVIFHPNYRPDNPRGFKLRRFIEGVSMNEIAARRGLREADEMAPRFFGKTMVHVLTIPMGAGMDQRSNHVALECIHGRPTLFSLAYVVYKDLYAYLRKREYNPPSIAIDNRDVLLMIENMRLVSLYSEDGIHWHSRFTVCAMPRLV